MWKRLSLAIVAVLALTAQVFASGTISLSLSQQFDAQGRPLSGGLLNFFVAGTTTPQNAFQDTALTIPYPNPIVLDASGRVPPFYLADGLIKIRLSTSAGVTVIAADNLLVIGPSAGGGGGGSVDATSVLATGDVKARYGTGTLSGFVRSNGRTIGSATSGATERANADCQALFEYLWTTDANLAVSGGRGGSANADWVANKTIALPDMRGRAVAGMDDMGGTAAGRLAAAGLGTSATVLGAAGGAQTFTLTTTELPAHAHTQQGAFVSGIESATHFHNVSGNTSTALSSLDHTHQVAAVPSTSNTSVSAGGGTQGAAAAASITSGFNNTSLDHAHNFSASSGTQSANHTHTTTISGSTASTGTGSAFSKVPPMMVMTFYMKL